MARAVAASARTSSTTTSYAAARRLELRLQRLDVHLRKAMNSSVSVFKRATRVERVEFSDERVVRVLAASRFSRRRGASTKPSNEEASPRGGFFLSRRIRLPEAAAFWSKESSCAERLQVILEGAQEFALETHALVRAPHELGVRRQSRQVSPPTPTLVGGGARTRVARAAPPPRARAPSTRRASLPARGGVLERPLQSHQAVQTRTSRRRRPFCDVDSSLFNFLEPSTRKPPPRAKSGCDPPLRGGGGQRKSIETIPKP